MNELTEDQLKVIQSKLDVIFNKENKAISKPVLYGLLSDVLIQMKVEQYVFELAITKAIRSDKIIGYEIKVGRSGGIRKIQA